MIKANVRPRPRDRGRGTGRTTECLRWAVDMLENGLYMGCVFVVQHPSFDRYCLQLVQDQLAPTALYQPASRKLYFKNKWGNLVFIQFVTGHEEYDRTRGLEIPTIRDHTVTENRSADRTTKGRMLWDLLLAAGRFPESDIFIPHNNEG